jgi:hypothetical protein
MLAGNESPSSLVVRVSEAKDELRERDPAKLRLEVFLSQNAAVRRRAEIALAKHLRRRGILATDSSAQRYPGS